MIKSCVEPESDPASPPFSSDEDDELLLEHADKIRPKTSIITIVKYVLFFLNIHFTPLCIYPYSIILLLSYSSINII
jgi:hypothetical protein